MPSKRQRAKRRARRRQAQTATEAFRTRGQTAACRELLDQPAANPLVLAAKDLHVAKGQFHGQLRIATDQMFRANGGLPISPEFEDVELWFGDTFPNRPPLAVVRHDRFADFPHVLVGNILCIYLDEHREWHPAMGVADVVTRLVDWFEHAASDRFDSRTALYHPIGGLPPSPLHRGTVVVRKSSHTASRPAIGRAVLDLRTPHRSDLLRWGPVAGSDSVSPTEAVVLRTTKPMGSSGLVNVATMGELVARVDHAGGANPLDALAELARLLPDLDDELFRVLVEVAHPTDPALTYLACAVGPVPRTNPQPRPNQLAGLPIGWNLVSDQRPEIATRRDHRRPTAALAGKTVELWGCGGLGSWMAEFIVRAGAERLVLRDNAPVIAGLLVRQNYLEDDVGAAKADQLATRLRAIADGVEIISEPSDAVEVLGGGFHPATDLLVDATINLTVGARLDEWAREVAERPIISQVATDPRSATLGMLVVTGRNASVGPATIDDATWAAIRDDPTLEPFHGFWTPPDTTDQIVPALGCSTPTFHGSAADMASLAGSFVNLLASHMETDAPGTHLIQSAHAQGGNGRGHHFVAYRPEGRPGAAQGRRT